MRWKKARHEWLKLSCGSIRAAIVPPCSLDPISAMMHFLNGRRLCFDMVVAYDVKR